MVTPGHSVLQHTMLPTLSSLTHSKRQEWTGSYQWTRSRGNRTSRKPSWCECRNNPSAWSRLMTSWRWPSRRSGVTARYSFARQNTSRWWSYARRSSLKSKPRSNQQTWHTIKRRCFTSLSKATSESGSVRAKSTNQSPISSRSWIRNSDHFIP